MIEQRSPGWFAQRMGKITASRVVDVCARTKTGWGASRANYAAQLIAERLTGIVEESYSNAAMQWGSDKEPEAKAAYEFLMDAAIIPAEFIEHPRLSFCGASPDGYVGDEGLVEIKCPNTATHIETLLAKSVDGKYITQMQFQMACTGRKWCDFVSYDPRMPETMRLWSTRIRRNENRIEELETIVAEFNAEIEKKTSELNLQYALKKVA